MLKCQEFVGICSINILGTLISHIPIVRRIGFHKDFKMLIYTFDRIELLTIHCYDDAITERKDERSMRDL